MEHDKRVGDNLRPRSCFYHPVEIRYVIKDPIAAPTLRADATMAIISFIVRSRSFLCVVETSHADSCSLVSLSGKFDESAFIFDEAVILQLHQGNVSCFRVVVSFVQFSDKRISVCHSAGVIYVGQYAVSHLVLFFRVHSQGMEKPSILLVMLEMPLQYNKSESYHIYSRSGEDSCHNAGRDKSVVIMGEH